MKKSKIILFFSLIISLSACQSIFAQKLNTFVSIEPEAYLVKQIGGDTVNVTVMVPQGRDPHDYQPEPRQILTLGKADLYFEIGMPFEKIVVNKIKGSKAKITIIDASQGIKRRTMARSEAGSMEIETDSSGKDPHIWLSVKNLKIMAKNIYKVLLNKSPQNAKLYKDNLAALDKRLDHVNLKIRKLLKPFNGETFFVYHPAFGYFADSYNLKQKAVEIEGKRPTPRELTRLIKEARKDNARIIFVQPQFNKKSAEVVARAINGAVVALNPLSENVIKNLQHIANEIEKALKKTTD